MRNYIFDLDGTLWNAAPASVKGWNSALDELGFTEHHITEQQMLKLVGHPRTHILKTLFPFITGDRYQEMYNLSAQYSFQCIKDIGGVLYPNVKSTLLQLSKEHKLFIVSNCQEEYLELFFNQSNTKSLFQDWECWGRSGKKKAANIKNLMRKNKIEDAFYIGDTEGDYQASSEAKTTFIQANYGFGETYYNNELSINSLEDLLSLRVLPR